MRLEFYPEEKLRREIVGVIGRFVDLGRYRAFLFGSRVTGKGDERSDIDVGIEGPEDVPPAALARIRETMEDLPTLYKIEVVDFRTVSPEFRAVALSRIEPLSPPA